MSTNLFETDISKFIADTAMFTPSVAPIVSHAPTKPTEVLPEIRQVNRGYCTICSIYPADLRKRVRHNGITIYEMKAAPRGSYSTLRVYDTQEWCSRPDPTDGKQHWMPMPIPAHVVAVDLVNTWAGDSLAAGKVSGLMAGIGIIAGDAPTVDEMDQLRKQQSALFNWFITDGMARHLKGQGNEITNIHRIAAKEMLDRGAERLPWYPVVDFAEVKDCIACGKQINKNAIRCQHCTTMLPQFYIEYGLSPEDDEAVSEFMAKVKKANPNAFKPVNKITSTSPKEN